MTRKSSESMPGLSIVSELVTAYSSMWSRQIQTINEVWTDVVCDEPTVDTWAKAWSKVLRSWGENAQDLCDVLKVHGFSAGGNGNLLTFVIDRTAETAGPQSVAVPFGVDPEKLLATPLVSLTRDGHYELDPRDAAVQLLIVNGHLEVSIILSKPRQHIDPGYYLALVCEPKAGAPVGHPLTASPDPPPRPVVANVLVLFL